MDSAIIVNASPNEVRVAVLENSQPVEILIERRAERGVVGNIYRGRVVRVLPGMQAAFVDIGLEKTGFLYVNDALPRAAAMDDEADENGETMNDGTEKSERRSRLEPLANIGDILKQGQELLVQVQKEPIGTKGARLTRHISIPGRYLVYTPFTDHVGVSRRIADDTERARLKECLSGQSGGFIVRTAAQDIDAATLENEAQLLQKLWLDIENKGQSGATPRLVFADLDLALRAIRDSLTPDVVQVVVDNADDQERLRDFIRSFSPGREKVVELYDGKEPIFDHFGIEVEIERALERRVWLKSGGYIVIDQAEALTVIDVNSGRFVGKSNLEDTITQINLEAVKEVAYQIRLRNLGGIIIVDFIDMLEQTSRDKVMGALEEALKRDKTKTTIVRMSDIGLVEITRKRTRDSLGHLLTDGCPYCKSRGFIKSETTIANEILRSAERTLTSASRATLLINTSPEIADLLYETLGSDIERLEKQFGAQLIPVAREGFHREHYEIVTAARAVALEVVK